jgi:hypothetical protein
MEANAAALPAGQGATYYVTAADTDDAIRQLRRKERLNMMQDAGRP